MGTKGSLVLLASPFFALAGLTGWGVVAGFSTIPIWLFWVAIGLVAIACLGLLKLLPETHGASLVFGALAGGAGALAGLAAGLSIGGLSKLFQYVNAHWS